MPRGFILQPTYRIESGRPVVLLYGRLEDGHSFLLRDTRQTPHFFIKQTDAAMAKSPKIRQEVERLKKKLQA